MDENILESQLGHLIWENLHGEVSERVRNAKRVDIAVAFWGKGAAKALGILNGAGRGANVRVLCNATSGGCNPFELEVVLACKGVGLKTNDRLHAKVYLIDEWLVVGSANASANGLVD